MLGLGVVQSFGANHVLMEEGEAGSHVALLRHAITKVTAILADGRQALLAIRVSGDIVGEISAFNGTPRSATVTTCGPSTISIIHRAELRSFLSVHPDVAMAIAGIVADRLRWANQRRVD